MLDVRGLDSVDGWVVHVFGCERRSILLEPINGAVEITILLCVLQRLPDEVDCEERVFQWNSAPWCFAAMFLDEGTSGEVGLNVCIDEVRDESEEWWD